MVCFAKSHLPLAQSGIQWTGFGTKPDCAVTADAVATQKWCQNFIKCDEINVIGWGIKLSQLT